MSGRRPPRLAAALLRLIRDVERRELVAGDLEEGYARRASVGTERSARRWYVSQVLRTVWRGVAWRSVAPSTGTPARDQGFADGLLSDLREALRGLRSRPGLTVVVAATLGLGVGVNTAMVGIADAVLFRPLPYPEPDRLLWVHAAGDEPGEEYGQLTYRDVERLKASSVGLAVAGAYSGAGRTLEMEGIAPLELDFARVTDGFFEAIGVRMAKGRSFTVEEAREGRPVVVLSHAFWMERLGGDPDVIGRALRIRGVTHEVVGVASPEMTFPTGSAFWRPLTIDEREDDDRELRAIGRMENGSTLQSVTARLAAASPVVVIGDGADGGWTLWAETMRSTLVQGARTPLLVLLGGALLVLLIACANVANLLLARSEERRRALAMRSALGAARGRLIRLQLLETGALAVAGGLAGVVAGRLVLPVLVALAPAATPRIESATVDLRVLTVMTAVVIVTTLFAGALPALGASTVAARDALTRTGRGRLGGAQHGVRRWLVSLQVALSTMLTIGAVLLVGTVAGLASADPGFEAGSVLIADLYPPPESLEARGGTRAYYEAALAAVESLPGVESVAIGSHSPGEGRGINAALFGLAAAASPDRPFAGAGVVQVTPSYLAVNGIRVLAGRGIEPSDGPGSPRVALLNARAATVGLGLGAPRAIGQRLVASDILTGERIEVEIVGVVDDVRPDPRQEARPLVYMPLAQTGVGFGALHVRVSGDAASVVPEMRSALGAFDARLPLNRISLLEDSLTTLRASPRFIAQILIAFGSLALMLAVLGTYSVTSYGVVRRMGEFGLRRALGAQRGRVIADVLRDAGVPVIAGAFAGLLGALAGTRLLASLLFGVNRFEPAVYAGVTVMIVLAAVAAAWLPARRASLVDPMVTLRQE